MTWLNVALAFLSPAAALTGAFLASVLQSRYSRRVEAVDNLTTLVHDVTRDFYPWIATYRIAGELDKHTKGLIISDKLNVLSAYRSRYSAVGRSKAALDRVVGQLGAHSTRYFNAMSGHFASGSLCDPFQLPESEDLKRAREEVDAWLGTDFPEELRRLEEALAAGLSLRPFWLRRHSDNADR